MPWTQLPDKNTLWREREERREEEMEIKVICGSDSHWTIKYISNPGCSSVSQDTIPGPAAWKSPGVLLKMQNSRPMESNSGDGPQWAEFPSVVLVILMGVHTGAGRRDSAPWAWECRLWVLRLLLVMSGLYNLIFEVLATKLSRSRVG